MTVLGNGLTAADHHEDALSVKEAQLSMVRRIGDSEHNILITQGNLAMSYQRLKRFEEALCMRQEVYSGRLRLYGEEHEMTLSAANNYATSLIDLQRFRDAESLLRRTVPTVRRVLGEGHRLTLNMRLNYARAFYLNTGATLDDLREAVTTLEDAERIARRVLGGAHPTTTGITGCLRKARVALKLAQECSEIAKTLGDTTLGEETPPERA